MLVMARRMGLRQRITIAALAYLLLVAVVVATHGYLVNERAEHLVWQSLLESELEHLNSRLAVEPTYRFADTETLKLYGPHGAAPPPELAGLSPGVHDEIRTPQGLYVALVRSPADGGDVLALDISGIEDRERTLTLMMFVSTAAVAAVLALITHLGVGWLVKPLSSLARAITSLAPNRPGERLTIASFAPREAEVIAVALNDYLQRIDEFVVRERAFVNMASHELRTPIAVISGAAEVALDDRANGDRVEAHLDHILRTTRDMERLITLLLTLAKDPARLRAAAETVDLRQLVPAIVRDHAFLAEHKELSFRLDIADAATTIQAPEQVVRAAIGNLVRNAVENCDRGLIDVKVVGSQVTIEDPGHGMSNEEMSALYTRLARAGDTPPNAGIGLELIARICEHLGWKLTFSSAPQKGTRAVLDLGAASLVDGQQDSDTRSTKV